MSMNDMLKRRLGQLAQMHVDKDNNEGRSLEELRKTSEILKGIESQRWRLFCTSNCMEPQRDLDSFGLALMSGEKDAVSMDYTSRMMKRGLNDETVEAIAKEYEALRWGPTEVPIFNLLLLFTQIIPAKRTKYLELARLFIESKVSVNGTDLSGTTALCHSFSTKPCLDLQFAQMMYDAGGDVNKRNRYGATVAHEIVMVCDTSDANVVRKSTKALEWFLSHGGNVDIADSDGVSPRKIIFETLRGRVPTLKRAVEEEDSRRKAKQLCCSL
ncbi:hypothetical protein CPC08DRAFT_589264, partial [Agrocybe pediades]